MLASSSLEKLNSVEETYYGVAKWVENPKSLAAESLSAHVLECYLRSILHLKTVGLGSVYNQVGFSDSAYVWVIFFQSLFQQQ